MKKIMLVCVLFLSTLLFAVEPIKNNMIKLTIIDNNTKELLVGVKVNDKYTDLDGNVYVNKYDKLTITFISYDRMVIDSICNDTLKLKTVNF